MIWVVIILLIIVILILSISLLWVIKKATYVSKKEREMIDFAIDMYINYGGELEILSDKHEVIIIELKKLKDKLNKNE